MVLLSRKSDMGSAPATRRIWTYPSRFFRTAEASGVCPMWLLISNLTSLIDDRNWIISSLNGVTAAWCNGVLPSMTGVFGFACASCRYFITACRPRWLICPWVARKNEICPLEFIWSTAWLACPTAIFANRSNPLSAVYCKRVCSVKRGQFSIICGKRSVLLDSPPTVMLAWVTAPFWSIMVNRPMSRPNYIRSSTTSSDEA